jgi:hypothetical protein
MAKQTKVQALKTRSRRIVRLLLCTILLLLLPAFASGIVAGLHLGNFFSLRRIDGIEAYTRDFEQLEFHASMSLPGLPMEDTPLPPFYKPYLYTTNWWERLDIKRCNPKDPECTLADSCDMDEILKEPINKMVRFEEFRRLPGSDSPTHYWIYFANFVISARSTWDKAFNQLLEHTDVHPAAHNASLQVVDCSTARFLCHIWALKPPTMVHMSFKPRLTDEERADYDQHESWMDEFIPVIRWTELPLGYDELRGTETMFPSYFEQMRRITHNDISHEDMPELVYHEMELYSWYDWTDEGSTGMARFIRWFNKNLLTDTRPTYLLPLHLTYTAGMIVGSSLFVLGDNLLWISKLPFQFAYNNLRDLYNWYTIGSVPVVYDPCQSPNIMYEVMGVRCVTGNFWEDQMAGGMEDFFAGLMGNLTDSEGEEVASKLSQTTPFDESQVPANTEASVAPPLEPTLVPPAF